MSKSSKVPVGSLQNTSTALMKFRMAPLAIAFRNFSSTASSASATSSTRPSRRFFTHLPPPAPTPRQGRLSRREPEPAPLHAAGIVDVDSLLHSVADIRYGYLISEVVGGGPMCFAAPRDIRSMSGPERCVASPGFNPPDIFQMSGETKSPKSLCDFWGQSKPVGLACPRQNG